MDLQDSFQKKASLPSKSDGAQIPQDETSTDAALALTALPYAQVVLLVPRQTAVAYLIARVLSHPLAHF